MEFRHIRNEVLAKRVIKNLESRKFEGYYAKSKKEALSIALDIIPKGSSISWGGTMSAMEIGLTKALKDGDYKVYDRDQAKTPEEVRASYLQAFDVDYYLGSVNALSEDGVLFNIDGRSNRVAAFAYGPHHILLIVGMNKVVKTQEDAMSRARNEASPINAQRFGINPPCVSLGYCSDCKHEESICCNIMITRFQRDRGRIKIILVDDSLGF